MFLKQWGDMAQDEVREMCLGQIAIKYLDFILEAMEAK